MSGTAGPAGHDGLMMVAENAQATGINGDAGGLRLAQSSVGGLVPPGYNSIPSLKKSPNLIHNSVEDKVNMKF